MGFLDSIFGGGNKCPVCGMKVDEKTGIKKHGKVFCSQACVEEYEKGPSKEGKKKKGSCCGCC